MRTNLYTLVLLIYIDNIIPLCGGDDENISYEATDLK